MTLPTMTEAWPVWVDGDRVVISNLAITHPEAAALAASQLDRGGADSLVDLVQRALPVGMVALSMGLAAVDTAAIQRTLDAFAAQVDARSRRALAGMDQTLARLTEGERTVTDAAQAALNGLPEQLEQALAGEAASVRAAVIDAARSVQAAGIQEVRAALAQHAEAVRNALSLDREGPVQALRQDVLSQLEGTRRDLTEQLTVVRGLLQAAEAHKAATIKSSRAVGQEFENQAISLASSVVTAAGDRFEETATSAAPGGTSRAGDALAVLSTAITGQGRPPVTIAIEAKHRSRPMSVKAIRDELAKVRATRQAHAGLMIVSTRQQVPGGCGFARVDDLAFVVVAEPDVLQLVYLVLREMAAMLHVRQGQDETVNLAKVEAHIAQALSALEDFDEVGRLAGAAAKNIENLRVSGGRVKARIHEALTASLSVLLV